MARGGSHRHSRGRRGRFAVSREQLAAKYSTTDCQAHMPPKIQAELDLGEADAQVLRHFIEDEAVNENICPWIPDTLSSRTRESQYFKTVDLYWHLKTLMGKVLVERNEAHQRILLQLDDVQLQIKLVDHKINLLAEKLDGMDFTKLAFVQPQVPIVDDHAPLV